VLMMASMSAAAAGSGVVIGKAHNGGDMSSGAESVDI